MGPLPFFLGCRLTFFTSLGRWFTLMDIIWPTSQAYFYVSHFMFIKMKFLHCDSCVMFAMKSMSICND